MRAKYPFLARTVMLLCAVLMTVTAWADNVTYLDSDGTTKTATGATKITETNYQFDAGGWYYVSGEFTINGALCFSTTDDVNIILCDDAALTLNCNNSDPRNCIYCGGNLTIYAHSADEHMGILHSIHYSEDYDVVKCDKDVTIKGGHVWLTGALSDNQKGISAQNISISDGDVTIVGSPIGLYATGNIAISGGIVAMVQGKIVAGNDITLGWMKYNDWIKADEGYEAGASGKVSVAASKPFKYDENGTLDGGSTLDATTLAAIKEKRLKPAVVARIGEIGYATFADALDHVASDETITLLGNVDESDTEKYFSPDENITLDLNNHTATIKAIGGIANLTIKNGTLTLQTINNANVNNDETLTIDNAKVAVTSNLQWLADFITLQNNANLEVQNFVYCSGGEGKMVLSIDATSQMTLTDCAIGGYDLDRAAAQFNAYAPHGKTVVVDGNTENNLILRNYSDYLALVDNMGNRGGVVTYYDFGITAPTAETFDPAKPGTDLTPYGNNILPGHYVVMDINVNPYTWTDAELLSCQETNGGTTVSDSRAVTLLARKIGTYTYSSGTFTYYDGKGWYCYQVPAANTVAAGYTQSELNGDVADVFDLDEDDHITQNGKVITVTTDGGWSAVLTLDEVSYKFDGNEHQPKYTSVVIKKGDVTKITLTDATRIGELLDNLNKGTTIGRHYLDVEYNYYNDYNWFDGDCWDKDLAGFDITVPFSTAKSYDANDPTTILGCETNPWLITSAAELNLLAKCVNIGRYTFKGEYLKVTENIDMSEIDDFMPIGTNASFCGTFDGNSKTISNLSLVLAPDNDEEEDDMGLIPVGLFGEVGHVDYDWVDDNRLETPVPAVIKNFTLKDCTFNDGGYSLWTGGVAGQVKKGSAISGVTLKGCTIQSSAFPRIMPIDDVLGYVVPCIGGVAGESVGLIENCTVEDCTISSQVMKLEPVPVYYDDVDIPEPDQWNVVGGIVGTTIQSSEEIGADVPRAKRRAPAQQPVSESRRRLRGNPIELGLTGNRVKGATTITSDIAGDVVSPVGAIFGELENGTVLSDNKYGLNVTVTRKMGSQETTTTTAKGYTPRGLTGLDGNDVVFKDITENEGAMMEVYPVTISPVATMTGYTMPNPLAEVTATEALEAGKNCYQIVEGTPYFAPTDNINLAVAATQITKKEDGRNLHADLALKMNSDDLTVTNGVATFTMPAAAATVTGTFTEASWFTVDTNNKKWMSFYHEWMTATDDKTGAGGQTPVAANYTVTDASENVNTPKTIVVKTVSNVNTKNGDVTMSDLAGVSFNGVPTLFSCQDGTALPAQLRFTPNTTATKPAAWAPEFKGVKEDTEMTGKDGVYIMNGSGDFIYAVITPADNTLAAHRCYIDMDNVTGGAPLRIVEDEEPTGIETTDNGQPTTDSWYTLSGVKLDEKPVVKGVYIHNGKKVVIK